MKTSKNAALVAQRFAACVLTILLTYQAQAQGTVEVNQNDPNATYKTIMSAVADVQPGTTILVHPGTYLEKVTISGVTLRALRGPEVTVIQSPDGTGDGVTLTGNQNVAIIGFRVQGFVNGIAVSSNGGDTKVANCIPAGNSGRGIVIAESVPRTVKIVNNTAADNGGDGFYTPATESRIVYPSVLSNLTYRNGGWGFGASNSWFPPTYGDYNCAFGNNQGQAVSEKDRAGTHSITNDPLVDSSRHYRVTSQSSPAVNSGHPGAFYNDPDGTRCDMGAYGGPEARNWWRDPFGGPTVENATIDPPQVRPGGKITIRATARTE